MTSRRKNLRFGGLDSLLSISEMPSGSPVVTVGVNKALNAGIYALKILANESNSIRKMLKSHKEKQHKSVLKESQDLKKMGLKKFCQEKVQVNTFNLTIFYLYYNMITRRNKLYLIGFGVVGIIFIVRFLS